jgi:peroxiredoxin
MTRWCVSIVFVIAVALSLPVNAQVLKTGAAAPEFDGIGSDGEEYDAKIIKDAKASVICFTSVECPVTQAYEQRFVEFSNSYKDRGVKFIAINVNKDESLEDVKRHAETNKLPYSYLYDASGSSALRFGARATPHVFVLDGEGLIVFQGAFDNNWRSNPTKKYVQDAVEAVLNGKRPEVTVVRPVGCIIRPRRR